MNKFEQLREFLTKKIGLGPWDEHDDEKLKETIRLEQFVCLTAKDGRIVAFVAWWWYPDRLLLDMAGGKYIEKHPEFIDRGTNMYIEYLAVDPDFHQLNGSYANLVKMLMRYGKEALKRAKTMSYHDKNSFFRRRQLTAQEKGVS